MNKAGSSVKSLVKALRLLKLFSVSQPEWSISEIGAALGFHKSSIHRLLTTLEAEGFLERIKPPHNVFRLGPQVLRLGGVAIHLADIAKVVRPHLKRLVELTHETSHCCVEDDYQCFYIVKSDSLQSIRIVTHVGQRLPLHCTGVGKALLSGMSVEKIDKVILKRGLPGLTKNSITNRQRLLEELAQIRKQGVAYDREEFELGLRCIAAPIFGNTGKVVAAISIAGPIQRMTQKIMLKYSQYVKEAAVNISKELGFSLDDNSKPKK